jgi:glycosyltransferase involved in cell wall biosynthesis
MIIAVDARRLSYQISGIANFLIFSMRAIIDIKPDWHFILLSNRKINPYYMAIIDNKKNIEVKVQPATIFKNNFFFWALTVLPCMVKKLPIDLLWELDTFLPVIHNMKSMVTVHDFIHKDFPHSMKLTSRIAFDLFYGYAITKADKLWANSYYTANVLEKYFQKRKCNDIVTGCSVNTEFFKNLNISIDEKKLFFDKYGLTVGKKILLFVGSHDKRKNIPFLLSLMPVLSVKNYELVIVGSKGNDEKNIKKILHEKEFPKASVHFFSNIGMEELRQFYNISDCFVSPSLIEGFGLPQLEAMFCSLPVVTANNSAMTEVVGGAGILVDGWDKQNWIRNIEMAIDNKDKIVTQYQGKLVTYDWNNIARRVVEYIEKEK